MYLSILITNIAYCWLVIQWSIEQLSIVISGIDNHIADLIKPSAVITLFTVHQGKCNLSNNGNFLSVSSEGFEVHDKATACLIAKKINAY